MSSRFSELRMWLDSGSHRRAMLGTITRVRLSALLADGVTPYPDQAIAIVRQFWQLSRSGWMGDASSWPAGLMSLRLHSSGEIGPPQRTRLNDGFVRSHDSPRRDGEPAALLAGMLRLLLTRLDQEPLTVSADLRVVVERYAADAHQFAGEKLPVRAVEALSFDTAPLFEAIDRLLDAATPANTSTASPLGGPDERGAHDSVDVFFAQLDPFAASDERQALRELFARWRSVHALCEPGCVAGAHATELPRIDAPESVPTSWTALRLHRQALGISLADLAERTEIPVDRLGSLERGDFRDPESWIRAREYARLYACETGVAERALLQLIDRGMPNDRTLTPAREPVGVGTPSSDRLPRQRRSPRAAVTPSRRGLGRVLFATAGVAVLLAGVWLRPGSDDVNRGSGTGVPPAVPPDGTSTDWILEGAGQFVRPPRVEPNNNAQAGAAASSPKPHETDGATRVTADTGARAAVLPVAMQPRPPVPVIRPDDVDDHPLFSPSFDVTGDAMYFHAGRQSPGALMKASLSETGTVLEIATILNDGARNYHVQVSPDGRQIAFDSDRDGERGIYLAARDGSAVRRVSGPGYAAIPTWSPDGRRVAFARAEANNGRVWNVWVVDVETNELTRLTSHDAGQPWGGSWLPDSRHICYSLGERLLVLDTMSGATRAYPSPVPGHDVRTPAVSPDGRHVIFQAYRAGTWLLDLQDGSSRRILADRSAEEFAWSPDSRRVAFHSRQSGEWGIWVMASPRE